MDSSVSAKDGIWFLRVCHHVSNALYLSVAVPVMKAYYPQMQLVTEHKTKNIFKTARFDLETGRKWNVSFMPWPLYPLYQLNRRLCGPHSMFGSF